jgi:predicted nucleic-acid-binding protein
MISVDTNILVRIFLENEPEQTKRAQNLMNQTGHGMRIFISSYALLEFVWVMKTKKIPRSEIYNALIIMADTPGITIGNREIVLSAAEKYHKGKADFGDYLILADGEHHGSKKIKTFDQAFISEEDAASQPS